MKQHAQHNDRFKSANSAGFDAFTLKLVALAGMTCNHAAYIFQPHIPFVLQCILFAAGGVTFPIMAFLLVEGYKHTHNVKRYAGRLAVFAAISQVPYWIFLEHNGNVIITLLLALLVLLLYDTLRNRIIFWISFLAITTATFWCDWGVLGPIMVLMFYVIQGGNGHTNSQHQTPLPTAHQNQQHTSSNTAHSNQHCTPPTTASSAAMSPTAHTHTPQTSQAHRESVIRTMLVPITADGLVRGMETLQNLAMLPFFLYAALGNTAALALLLHYNGQRGKPLKWAFYVYYPLHITVLGVVAMLI